MDKFEKAIFYIIDLLRGNLTPDKSFKLAYAFISYKVLVDFKHEEKYIREPHIIQNYLAAINFENMEQNPTIFELMSQLEELDIKSFLNYEDYKEINESTLFRIVDIIKDFDLTKEIIRGNYKEIADTFFNLLDSIMDRIGRVYAESTTPNAINLILKNILEVKENETLLDPCFGAGLLANIVGEKAKAIYGQEINNETYYIGKMNSLIANKLLSIEKGDSLLDPKFHKADVVVCNNPFGLKTYNLEHYSLDYLEWGIPPVNSCDYYFISLVLSNIKNRGAIVVSEGALFRGFKEGEIRKNIIDSNCIEGVISLPTGIFKHTGITTSLIIFNKNKNNDSIFLIDTKEMFIKAKKGVTFTEEAIKEIADIYKNRTVAEGISRNVTLEELKENDYILSVNRYIEKNITYAIKDPKALLEEVENLYIEIKDYRQKTDEILKQLMEGYE